MNSETAIETFIDLLKQGKSVIHTAEGYSMFPTLKPGDKILVKSVNETGCPAPGCIVIVLNGNTLIIHRLIEIRYDYQGERLFITRGDSMSEHDSPWHPEQLIGVADSFTRRTRKRSISIKTLAELYYKKNRILLWIWFKLRKLRSSVTKVIADES